MSRLRVATWNMHGGVGIDGRFSPERIARVIAELDADIVALQEFGSRDAGFDMRLHLETASNAHATLMPTFQKYGCDFGNAILSRLPVSATSCHKLGLEGREPRNAIELDVDLAGTKLRVVTTHLGLRRYERHGQIETLAKLIGEPADSPIVLLGDFNEWFAGRATRVFDRRFGMSAAPATFPAPLPVIALDRVWVWPPQACIEIRTHRSALARIASDHLPLIATLEL